MTEKIYVKDLEDKQSIQSLFLAKEKAVLTGKNGKTYISLCLSDRSGIIDARVWDNVETINEAFQSGDVVKVKGQVQIFQNRKQLVVHRLEKALQDEFAMADLISAAKRSGEEMYQQLVQIVNGMQDPSLKQLTMDTLNDPEVRARLMLAPAAKSIHHAVIGGLLEHILSICQIMQFLGGHYPHVKTDLLLFGAIFHDIGKIWELEVSDRISYTDKGRLIGHMVLAVELVERKAAKIFGFPEELKDMCKHIILSHHGKVEYGSPKLPSTLEAFLVAAVDDLDSKVNTISNFIEQEKNSGEKWSRYNQLFERYFFLKD